jgi:hypothetical protein
LPIVGIAWMVFYEVCDNFLLVPQRGPFGALIWNMSAFYTLSVFLVPAIPAVGIPFCAPGDASADLRCSSGCPGRGGRFGFDSKSSMMFFVLFAWPFAFCLVVLFGVNAGRMNRRLVGVVLFGRSRRFCTCSFQGSVLSLYSAFRCVVL